MPFDPKAFDLVVAFMSVQDFDDADGACARRPGARAGRSAGPRRVNPLSPWRMAPAEATYFERFRYAERIDRDGLAMTIHRVHLPFGDLVSAVFPVDLTLDAITEPRFHLDAPPPRPDAAGVVCRPCFLHLRGRRRSPRERD